MPSPVAEATRVKYRGGTASGYEAKRTKQVKWQAEDRVIREMLAGTPSETVILDIPFGTGRFVPLYEELGAKVIGLDSSDEMLALARPKIKSPRIECRVGDIFKIDLPDKSVEVALAIRIMNLISPEDMQAALRELQRVTKSRIIFNLRVWHKDTKFRRPQKMETMLDALDGFTITVDREIHTHDFRMFELCAV